MSQLNRMFPCWFVFICIFIRVQLCYWLLKILDGCLQINTICWGRSDWHWHCWQWNRYVHMVLFFYPLVFCKPLQFSRKTRPFYSLHFWKTLLILNYLQFEGLCVGLEIKIAPLVCSDATFWFSHFSLTLDQFLSKVATTPLRTCLGKAIEKQKQKEVIFHFSLLSSIVFERERDW